MSNIESEEICREGFSCLLIDSVWFRFCMYEYETFFFCFLSGEFLLENFLFSFSIYIWNQWLFRQLRPHLMHRASLSLNLKFKSVCSCLQGKRCMPRIHNAVTWQRRETFSLLFQSFTQYFLIFNFSCVRQLFSDHNGRIPSYASWNHIKY